jgi:hypothetical protein
MFEARPKDPTITTMMGEETSGTVNSLWIHSRKMLKQRARRKTPLMRAPRISARCQPYEYLDVDEAVASLMA